MRQTITTWVVIFNDIINKDCGHYFYSQLRILHPYTEMACESKDDELQHLVFSWMWVIIRKIYNSKTKNRRRVLLITSKSIASHLLIENKWNRICFQNITFSINHKNNSRVEFRIIDDYIFSFDSYYFNLISARYQ